MTDQPAPEPSKQLTCAITLTTDNAVKVEFSKPIEWFRMEKQDALNFAALIVKRANELE
jgi:hypothetical protein